MSALDDFNALEGRWQEARMVAFDKLVVEHAEQMAGLTVEERVEYMVGLAGLAGDRASGLVPEYPF